MVTNHEKLFSSHKMSNPTLLSVVCRRTHVLLMSFVFVCVVVSNAQFVFIYVFLLLFPDNKLIRIERSGVYPEEIVFISIVIIVWVIAVFVFLKQWNSIRILEPIEPRVSQKTKK
jgi:hypothetical protein